MAEALAEAARASGIPHIVLLSSLGAQHAEGNGPVRGLHHAEQAIGKAAKSFTALRASYFLENWIPVLGEARTKGVLPCFFTPGRAIPMVGARDIGRAAAEALLDPARGTRILELVGPADWSPEDIAREVGACLGRDVRALTLPLDAVVPAFTSMGMTEGAAGLFRELFDAINRGHVAREPARAMLRIGAFGPREVFGPILSPAAR
jgi:uncharacterized protein YbjT (DUF2867 family)